MTPTEERELLELAAKACGLKVELAENAAGDLVWMRDCQNEHFGCGVPWNPLHNSGECFDARAKRRIKIEDFANGVRVVALDNQGDAIEKVEMFYKESDRPAATRLAVTRALAEIGKSI